ncbi:tail assembly protein [Pseudomonas corrugata]
MAAVASGKSLTMILLSGSLAQKFGREHPKKLETGTTREAFSALVNTVDGFKDFIHDSSRRGLRYAIFRNRKNVGIDSFGLCGSTEIRIVPVISGSKNGGLFQTIVGVVLVVVGAVASAFGQGWIGVPLMQMGAAMAIGGVIQMLSPVPKGPSQQEQGSTENKPSYLFNGAFNSTQQGLPVPVIYGKMLVGSSVVAIGTWAEAIPA